MKKLGIVLIFVFFNSLNTFAQKVNEKVEIESSGVWYPGKLLKVNEDTNEYYVSYDGWGEGSDEWVTIDRLKYKKATGKYKIGDRIQVEYGMIPEAATVKEVGENKYLIVYDKTLFGEKWVGEGQIKKL